MSHRNSGSPPAAGAGWTSNSAWRPPALQRASISRSKTWSLPDSAPAALAATCASTNVGSTNSNSRPAAPCSPGLRAARHRPSGIGDHGGEVRLRGRIPLRETPASPLAGAMDLSVDAEAWPLADVRPWLPEELLDLPVDGRFDGQLVLRGDPEEPSGEVRGRLEEAAWSGLVLGTSRLRRRCLAGGRRAAPGSTRDARRCDLGQRLDRPATRPGPTGIRFSGPLRLDDPPFALANRDRDEGLSGEVVVDGRISGSSERPNVEAVAELSGLALAGRPLVGSDAPGRGTIRATWRDLVFDVRAEVPGLVEVTGGGPLAWKGEGVQRTSGSGLDPRRAARRPGGPERRSWRRS